jgi:hypothetical protein
MKACWILGTPSSKAEEKLAQVSDSKMVGNKVVFSLHMCDIETAAETLNGSNVCVWYIFRSRAATLSEANVQPAEID